jgi:hypothetical protein
MTIEELIGCGIVAWSAGTAIEGVSGSVESFRPEHRGHGAMEQGEHEHCSGYAAS